MPRHHAGPAAFHPRRIAGRGATDLAARLATALPALETRTVGHGQLSVEDARYTGYTVPPNLADSGVRWVHLPMAGIDRVVGDLAGSDVVLTRTVGAMPQTIGTYVLAHLLADAWHLRDYADQQSRARCGGRSSRFRPRAGPSSSSGPGRSAQEWRGSCAGPATASLTPTREARRRPTSTTSSPSPTLARTWQRALYCGAGEPRRSAGPTTTTHMSPASRSPCH